MKQSIDLSDMFNHYFGLPFAIADTAQLNINVEPLSGGVALVVSGMRNNS